MIQKKQKELTGSIAIGPSGRNRCQAVMFSPSYISHSHFTGTKSLFNGLSFLSFSHLIQDRLGPSSPQKYINTNIILN